jgi:hypothetical protein
MSGNGMNCTEAKRYLDLFLDGELTVEQNLKVLEHLNLCGCCSKVFDGEKLLAVEAQKAAEKCPEALKRRVEACLQREGRPRLWMVAAAAAILAAGIGIGIAAARLFVPAPRPANIAAAPIQATEFARLAAAHHDEVRSNVPEGGVCVCGDCTKAPKEQLETFFRKNGQTTCLHDDAAQAGYVWKSGEIWKGGVKGRYVCMTFQVARDRGVMLSHAALPSTAISLEGGTKAQWGSYPVRVYNEGGRVVIAGEGNGYV